MAAFEIRPHFRQKTSLSTLEIKERIALAIKEKSVDITDITMDNHIILKIPVNKQHYWSPQLDIDLIEEGKESILIGRFGPRPSVWLLFVFFYSILGFISLIVLIMGLAQMNLGMSANILWVLVLTITLFIFLLFTARTGQQLGEEEMIFLKKFLFEAIGAEVNNTE